MSVESHDKQRLLLLFPGALGDFLCALPAILAVTERCDDALLVANPLALELLEPGPFRTASIHRREVADLFGDGPLEGAARMLFAGYDLAHSWTGFGQPQFAERLRAVTGATVLVHRFRGMLPGEHAIDYYARCVGLAPASPRLWLTAADQAGAADWQQRVLGAGAFTIIHPGSGSPRKNWQGFPQLIEKLRATRGTPMVVLSGPAEAERGSIVWPDVPVLHSAPPRRIAALLRRAALYIGNDSGISHLAAVAGTPSVVLFGTSDPAIWAPRGPAVHIIAARQPCAACGPECFCTHRLAVEQVIDRVQRLG
ncbi:MAG: glycosyltransferase family 9 protein [Deltaproteobacteria bacterium]|nr:glycosyltransferase family 9 protein [Deltaproteobacteria bacterium]